MIDPLRLVGAKPPGNPASLRHAAAVARAEADAVHARALALATRASGVAYEGPAATAFRGRTHSLVADLRHEAWQLGELANYYLREAGAVETRQRDWNRRYAAAKAKAAELARQATMRSR